MAVHKKNGIGLTEKQQRVADLIRNGATNKEIGFRLQLSEKTVKAHCTSVYKALGVRNRTEASLRLTAGPPTRPTPEQVIERIFRAIFPTAEISVRYLTEEEQWHVVVNSDEWVMQVGSDDDQFHFRHWIPGGPGPGYNEMVSFPFPTDWEF